MLRILIIILALASSITVDAQHEVIGAYVKKGGTESGINATSRFIWELMEGCQTGGDRLPAAVPNSAKIVHKTGTGYPMPSGQPSSICDVGIIILDNGQQLPIAVFITNPSSQSRISCSETIA